MLVNLSISMFSPKKTDKKVTADVIRDNNASSDAGKFVKSLLPEEACEEIRKIAGEARQWHYEHSLPWTDEGARILPSAHYLEYTEAMRKFRARFEIAVEAFVSRYPEFVETAKSRLNGMFKAADYPEHSAIQHKFKFKTDFLPLPSGADFRVDVAEDEVRELRQQVDERVKEAQENAVRDLWQRLAEPIQCMVNRLSDPDAKFKDTLVGNLRDIVQLIPILNFTGDSTLEDFRRRVQADLLCYSADGLRNSNSARRETAERARQILATLSDYLPQPLPPACRAAGDCGAGRDAATPIPRVTSPVVGFLP